MKDLSNLNFNLVEIKIIKVKLIKTAFKINFHSSDLKNDVQGLLL